MAFLATAGPQNHMNKGLVKLNGTNEWDNYPTMIWDIGNSPADINHQDRCNFYMAVSTFAGGTKAT